MKNREIFYKHQAQTTDNPLGLEISGAKGNWLCSREGQKILDLVGGYSVNNIGHCQPSVCSAVKKQIDDYAHLMVYGEFIQEPQARLVHSLTQLLPEALQTVYLVNSGSEAIEGAMKLAKRYTNRSEIVCFEKAYHGSTQGALSLMGDEAYKRAYRPLLPDIRMLPFNDKNALTKINERTAAVVIEPIQAEAGVRVPDKEFITELRNRCNKYGVLLIFDEVQTGFGRTGSMFAFESLNVVPDILVLGKALGGGMPLAAFVSSHKIMEVLKENPMLGH